MTDLLDTITPTQPRRLTRGETPCQVCGKGAVFFLGLGEKPQAWCRTCAPAEFRPGRDK